MTGTQLIMSLFVSIVDVMSFLSQFIGPLMGAAGSIANIVAPGIGGSVAGVIGNAISAGSNQYNDNKAIDKYNQGQLELAKYVADRNLGFWNLQNEYNAPKNQMQRYIDAGLNPNLIYGQINNGNSSAVQAFNMPAQERKQYKATVNAALGLQLQNAAADTKVKNAQANRLNADAELIRSRKSGQDIENTISGYLQGEAKLKFDAINSAAGSYEEAVQEKYIFGPISQSEAIRKRNRILEISALTAEYLYEHGSPELQLEAAKLLNSIRSSESHLKSNMAAWSDMGINPNQDGFLIRQLGVFLRDNKITSLSDALNLVIDKFL